MISRESRATWCITHWLLTVTFGYHGNPSCDLYLCTASSSSAMFVEIIPLCACYLKNVLFQHWYTKTQIISVNSRPHCRLCQGGKANFFHNEIKKKKMKKLYSKIDFSVTKRNKSRSGRWNGNKTKEREQRVSRDNKTRSNKYFVTSCGLGVISMANIRRSQWSRGDTPGQ